MARVGEPVTAANASCWGGEKRREFDAHEIFAFACAFDVPLPWFFLPPPGDTRRLAGASDRINELYTFTLGREDHAGEPAARRQTYRGVPERAVMGIMGWSNSAMAVRYQHITAAVRRDVAQQVDGLLWPASPEGE